ncbi:MAG TPA: hypothetical protein VFF69_13585 [Phycisphaerales bacterium]|nr:hypothetical protein [Phycisphaerales bacterium]
MPSTRSTALAALAACPLLIASCGGARWGWVEPAATSEDLRPDYNPFAPMSLRIYPLTHLAPADAEQTTLVCHIELRDRWGDAVKALGKLQVQLYRPRGGLDATTAEQVLKWDVRLEDEQQNAALYDPATQTYRLALGGLPQWIADRARAETAPADTVRLELRAVFQTLGPSGEEKVLRDSMALEV